MSAATPARARPFKQELTTAGAPFAKSHGTPGSRIAREVATPMTSASLKSWVGSDRYLLAAIPRPSAINSPAVAAMTTDFP